MPRNTKPNRKRKSRGRKANASYRKFRTPVYGKQPPGRIAIPIDEDWHIADFGNTEITHDDATLDDPRLREQANALYTFTQEAEPQMQGLIEAAIKQSGPKAMDGKFTLKVDPSNIIYATIGVMRNKGDTERARMVAAFQQLASPETSDGIGYAPAPHHDLRETNDGTWLAYGVAARVDTKDPQALADCIQTQAVSLATRRYRLLDAPPLNDSANWPSFRATVTLDGRTATMELPPEVIAGSSPDCPIEHVKEALADAVRLKLKSDVGEAAAQRAEIFIEQASPTVQ